MHLVYKSETRYFLYRNDNDADIYGVVVMTVAVDPVNLMDAYFAP